MDFIEFGKVVLDEELVPSAIVLGGHHLERLCWFLELCQVYIESGNAKLVVSILA